MPFTLYSPEVRRRAQELLDRVLSQHDGSSLALSFQISLDLRTLRLISSHEMLEGDLLQALSEMKKVSESTVARLEEHVRLAQNERHKREQIKKRLWRIFIPLKCELAISSAIESSAKVLDQLVTLVTWSEACRRMSSQRDLLRTIIETKMRDEKMRPGPNYACLCFEVTAHDSDHATRQVVSAMMTLLGLLEASLQWGAEIWDPQEISANIPHPRFILLQDSTTLEMQHWVEARDCVWTAKLDDRVWLQTKNHTQSYASAEASDHIRTLLAHCFRLYYAAQNAKASYEKLVAYWQLAETIALTEATDIGGKTSVVAERIARYALEWQFDSQNLPDVLAVTARHRNRIVHDGDTPDIEADELNIIATLCKTAITFIERNARIIGKKDTLALSYRVSEAKSRYEQFRNAFEKMVGTGKLEPPTVL